MDPGLATTNLVQVVVWVVAHMSGAREGEASTQDWWWTGSWCSMDSTLVDYVYPQRYDFGEGIAMVDPQRGGVVGEGIAMGTSTG